MADNLAHPYNRRQVLIIDDLPDDVLLEIFDFCVVRYQDLDFPVLNNYKTRRKIESWQSLVHVCRRWRSLVFGSPRGLRLQLHYDPEKSARKSLDIWPALPLFIDAYVSETSTLDCFIGLLEPSDRVHHIILDCSTIMGKIDELRTTKLWEAMQVPFPELVGLYLSNRCRSDMSVLPDSFLGGSAPRLQHLCLLGIPFPGLPKLLLSATHLVHLCLRNIPRSGYISPEAMATCLSMLTSLELLYLEFKSRQSYPNFESRRSFPPSRSFLPALTNFWFKGMSEYLEEFVARIDAPQLLSSTFFDDIDFDTPGLNQFISRAPTFGRYDGAHLIFVCGGAIVRLRQSHPGPSDHRLFEVTILGDASDRYLSSMAKICTLSLRPLLTMENLYIHGLPYIQPYCKDNTEWLELLLPFTAVKNLYLSEFLSPSIGLVLQELTGGRTTEVLPTLQNILLEGFRSSEPVQEGIAQFISARQLTNHPVAISVWDRNLGWDVHDW